LDKFLIHQVVLNRPRGQTITIKGRTSFVVRGPRNISVNYLFGEKSIGLI